MCVRTVHNLLLTEIRRNLWIMEDVCLAETSLCVHNPYPKEALKI
jgi:hypothetical protein